MNHISICGFFKKNRNKKLTILSYLLSAKYRFLILNVKPERLRKYWGEEGKESEPVDTKEHYQYAYQVSKVVNRICSKTEWESKCLVRALTAQKLLAYKGIHTTMYLGCGLEEGKMVAHAWLRCGEMHVTGGNGAGYAVVDKFYK